MATPSDPSSRPQAPAARRWRMAAGCLAIGLVAWHGYDVGVAGLSDRTGRLKAPDFLQFYTYGALVQEGARHRLYDPSAHAEVARRRVDPRLTLTAFHPNYSPVIAWLAAPLARLPYLSALALFSAVSAALYGSAVALLGLATRGLPGSRGTLLLFSMAWPTLFAVLRYGQISAVTLLVVVTATVAASRGRAFTAGVALGLLAYKPNLLLVPVLLLGATRQWRLLLGLAAGAGGQLFVDVWLAGLQPMREYVGILAALARRPELVQFFPAESHSLRGFVELLAPWPPLVTAASWLGLPGAAWLAARVWRAHDDWRPRWAALITAALVASPHLLTYDLLILAVPLVLTVDWWLRRRGAVPAGHWHWALALLYFGVWPGTLIARVYHVQVSTVGMVWLLWLLAAAPREDQS